MAILAFFRQIKSFYGEDNLYFFYKMISLFCCPLEKGTLKVSSLMSSFLFWVSSLIGIPILLFKLFKKSGLFYIYYFI